MITALSPCICMVSNLLFLLIAFIYYDSNCKLSDNLFLNSAFNFRKVYEDRDTEPIILGEQLRRKWMEKVSPQYKVEFYDLEEVQTVVKVSDIERVYMSRFHVPEIRYTALTDERLHEISTSAVRTKSGIFMPIGDVMSLLIR